MSKIAVVRTLHPDSIECLEKSYIESIEELNLEDKTFGLPLVNFQTIKLLGNNEIKEANTYDPSTIEYLNRAINIPDNQEIQVELTRFRMEWLRECRTAPIQDRLINQHIKTTEFKGDPFISIIKARFSRGIIGASLLSASVEEIVYNSFNNPSHLLMDATDTELLPLGFINPKLSFKSEVKDKIFKNITELMYKKTLGKLVLSELHIDKSK